MRYRANTIGRPRLTNLMYGDGVWNLDQHLNEVKNGDWPIDIVKDSLCCWYDTAHKRTILWTQEQLIDLVQPSIYQGNEAYLDQYYLGGPAFVSDGGGSLKFNATATGTGDQGWWYAPGADGSPVATIEFFAKIVFPPNSPQTWAGMPFSWYIAYDVYTATATAGNLSFNTGNSGDQYGIPAATVSSLGLSNAWKHYAFVMRADVAYTSGNKIYINGTQQSLTQIAGTPLVRDFRANPGGTFATWDADYNYHQNITFGNFRVYSRELTSTEISRNFNTQRSKYGI